MLSKEEKLELLNEVLENPKFSTSKTFRKLLKYLVVSTINEVKIKEYSIATEVFEKDADFNPSEDSSVRVYISNLRKKLNTYYDEIGTEAKYRIKIPKGKYEVEFVKVSNSNIFSSFFSNNYTHYIIYSILSLIITFLVILHFSGNSNYSSNESSSITGTLWDDIIQSDMPIEIVIGNDLFFIEEPKVKDPYLDNIYSEEIIVRRHLINSIDEFDEYKLNYKNKERNVKEITTYPFFPYPSVSTLPKISRILKSDSDYSLNFSSEMNVNDFLKNNIIFIGSFRNLYAMDQTINKNYINYKIKYANSYFEILKSDSLYIFTLSGTPDKEYIDYCLVRKIPGPKNNTILMFLTFHNAAIVSTVNYMTNKESLMELKKKFIAKLGKMPQYFDVVFKISGYERTAYSTKIEYYNSIDSLLLPKW